MKSWNAIEWKMLKLMDSSIKNFSRRNFTPQSNETHFSKWIFFSKCSCALPWGRQMPQPDLSALKDDMGTLPECDYFLPAVMQTLHYYTEMMQYELLPVQNAPPETTAKPTTTKKPPTTTRRTTTTTRPTTTTTRPTTTTKRTTTTQRTTTTTRPTTTTQRPTTTTKPTTPKPTWWKPPPTTQSTSTIWWIPPTKSTTKKPTTVQQDYIYSTEIELWRKFLCGIFCRGQTLNKKF